MSGIDPLAALLALDMAAAAESAVLEAVLDLGMPAGVLKAQISTGDLLPATVLVPQNGQDLIQILGRPVVAQLPPEVHPGETLLIQVTGFSERQILVRNLGPYDPQSPPQEAGRVVTAILAPPAKPAEPPPVAANATPAEKAPPSQPLSPPRAVFVAASVRPAQVSASHAPPASAMPPRAPALPGIEARIAAAQTAKPLRAPAAPAIAARVQSMAQNAASVVQRAIRSTAEFLRSARVPDTPLTRTAAAIAPQAAARLPAVLQRLEAALPRDSGDPRIPTLRTLIAFTATLEPANVETLPAQISAYVSHVAQGVEPKLQQLLRAHADVQAHSAPVAQAHVAERAAAAQHDLKSLVLSLLRDPPADRPPALMQALSETSITLTGVQLNVLAANAQDPGAIALALPVFFHEGGKPAYVRITRGSDSHGGKMSADTFHVAFVLETANLGTVAIDVQSTGRSMNLEVKTEREPAAARFSETLPSLRARLEHLRYRVTSATSKALRAPVAPRSSRVPRATSAKGVDLQA